jgi:hypothetical protein
VVVAGKPAGQAGNDFLELPLLPWLWNQPNRNWVEKSVTHGKSNAWNMDVMASTHFDC